MGDKKMGNKKADIKFIISALRNLTLVND